MKKISTQTLFWILGGVFAFCLIVAIIVTVVVLTRRPIASLPSITVTPSVILTPINPIESFQIQENLGGVTPTNCLLYLQNSIAGIVLSANHVIDTFVTVNVTNRIQLFSKNFPTSLGYSNYNVLNGATFSTSDQFIYTFMLNLTSTTIDGTTIFNKIPTNDTTKFNASLYIVSDSKTIPVIVSSFVLSNTLQSYNLISYDVNGNIIPTFQANLSAASTYFLLLASSLQDFISLLVFDQTLSIVYNIFINSNALNISTINISNTLVYGAATSSSNILIIISNDTVYLYRRNVMLFVFCDSIILPFTLIRCAIDASGIYFSISTSNKMIIIGKIDGTNIVDLRIMNTLGSNLLNTNGHCAIQADSSNVYVLQTDTIQNCYLFKLPIF
jgi:hypothetical protein